MGLWLSWKEIARKEKDRSIVLYGRSEDWIPKTLRRLSTTPQLIIDKNPSFAGQRYRGIEVALPEALDRLERHETFVIITSGSYASIRPVLEERGWVAGEDFCCCPEYKDLSLLEEIRSYDADLLVSSSDHPDPSNKRSSKLGGGILRLNTATAEATRLAQGSFRQMVEADGTIYAVEFVEQALYRFDRDFRVIERFELDAPGYCGLAFDERRDQLVLVNSTSDELSFHSRETFKLVERVAYSHDPDARATSRHHLNDAEVVDDSLYVTYFSHSGNWQNGIYDGGVSQLDLRDPKRGPTVAVTGLWQPHSPKFLDGELCFLDSMRGSLHVGSQRIAGRFPGFARALAFDGRFYYVGMSEGMYLSRLAGLSDNIMLNAGVFLFDAATKASRFYPLYGHMNVHDILIPSWDRR